MKSGLLPLFVAVILVGVGQAAEPAGRFELPEGARVVFLGDALIEGEQAHGWIELMLTARFPERNITFRNLGWSGDTPAGESRLGLSLLQAGREPPDEGWRQLLRQLEEARPTVLFIGYGMANSFAAPEGLPQFRADFLRLLEAVEQVAPGAQVVLLGPIRHEALGAPWPEPAAHNVQLGMVSDTIRELAAQRRVRFLSLFEGLAARMATPAAERLTHNGVHLNEAGYRFAAEVIEEQLFGAPGSWRGHARAEPLRQAIRLKNEWFFHRSRPANMAYIFGFRKREQGRNAVEMEQFDAFIAAEERRIALLRGLAPGEVPEIPRRVGNLAARPVAQPLPQFDVADGFEISLWAENPQLHKPIQMNFDPQGRLWVASSEVYPQLEPGQAASDKIIVLEDTQGSGRADKATVFADGLLIPTGLAPGDGGVYVAQSTELLFLQDTDGDGRADVRRTVLSGFGTEDTHHNLHTLRWGPDGRLFMNQAVYTRTNTETPHGVVRLQAGGVFRLDPRDQRTEIVYRGWVNSWGHQFDAFGQSFLTDGAGNLGINWGVPGATYRTLAPARRLLQSVSPGSYPKFSGIEIVRSAHFPDDWQGDVITCDFRAHRVVRFKLAGQGAGYVTREMPDVLRTTAASFRPIDVKLGPDGALYLADWSNPIIQHGEVDFRDPRRDKEHGRIWRIAAKGRAPLPRVDFTRRTNVELLDALRSHNGLEQDSARRVLLERGAGVVLAELDAWTRRQTDDEARLAALWLYQGFNHPQPALFTSLLAADDARIRAAAVRALPIEGSRSLPVLARLVADEHPRVRLEAVRALGKVGTGAAAERALTVLERPMDPFLDYALWLTINELALPWLEAVKSGAWTVQGREEQLGFALKAIEPALASEVLGQLLGSRPIPRDGSGPWLELIGVAGGTRELRLLFGQVLRSGFDEPAAARALRALTQAARLRQAKPDGDLARFGALFTAQTEELRIAAVELAGAWKVGRFGPQLLRSAGEPGTSSQERTAAFAALREIGGAGIEGGLRQLLAATTSPEVRRHAVVTLAGLNWDSGLPAALTALKATADEAEAQALWRGLLGVSGAGAKLAAAVPGAGLGAQVARAGLRPAREGSQNQALVRALLQSAGLTLDEKQLSPAELGALAEAALAQGDAVRGEQIYRQAELACVACHAIGGAGGKLGPDLTSIGASAPADYIVEALLYPNARIKEGYHAVAISTRDGRDLSGMLVREGADEIVLRTLDGAEVSLAPANIARRSNADSLMPAGLLDALLPEERLDLIKFLSLLGRPGAFDAARGGVARAWKLYLVVSANQPIGMEPVVRGDFALRDWVPAFSLVNGVLPREVFEAAFPVLTNARGLFAATRFEAGHAGVVNFTLSGRTKGAWLNGQPIRPASAFALSVNAGLNTLVLQLDESSPPEALRLESPEVAFVAP